MLFGNKIEINSQNNMTSDGCSRGAYSQTTISMKHYLCAIVLLSAPLLIESQGCRYGRQPQCAFPCHCYENEVCNEYTGTCPNGCELAYLGQDWHGPGCQKGNMGYRHATNQTGTYNNQWSYLAVDGILGTNDSEANCARMKNPEGEPAEWLVTFPYMNTKVESVLLYSTYDLTSASRLTNFSFLVRNESGSETVCLNYTGTAPVGHGGTLSINCLPPVVGSFGVIRRIGGPDIEQLTLCEVIITGHRYIDCSHCPTSCSDVSGCSYCPSGLRLPDCKTQCSAGYWGQNCARTCGNCVQPNTCNIVTGSCPAGCRAGWVGPRCDQSITPSSTWTTFSITAFTTSQTFPWSTTKKVSGSTTWNALSTTTKPASISPTSSTEPGYNFTASTSASTTTTPGDVNGSTRGTLTSILYIMCLICAIMML